MIFLYPVILFSALAATAAFAQTASDTVSFVDFENREPGVYGNALAKEDFKRNDYDKSWWYAMDKNNGENSYIVYDGEEHGNVLQLKYPKGCVGPNDNDTRMRSADHTAAREGRRHHVERLRHILRGRF